MGITDKTLELQTVRQSPSYEFEIQKKQYLIKIANTPEEFIETFKLRKKVYSQQAESFNNNDLDQDIYDDDADHLIVVDTQTGRITGTYRLLLSDKVKQHYAQREFDLNQFLSLPGRKLELGRASVDPDMRSGVIITLLWRGIAEYIKVSNVDYLFGCSTIWDVSLKEAISCRNYFKEQNIISDVQVSPLTEAYPEGWEECLAQYGQEFDPQITAKIPTLVKTYIHTGAKFTELPAFDSRLNAYEFFGYLKISDINPIFKKKYLDPK